MGIYKTSINLLAVSLLVLAACSPRPSAVRDALPKPPVVNSTVIPSKVVYFPDPQGLQSVRLFKSTNYPPHTVEEKAMWEWYDAMEKADESWQWKMPIEFYGKVIDQFSNPVVGAEVVLNWTTVIGPIPDPKKTIFTDTDGRFEIKGIQGKGISIFVYGEGYDRTHDSIGDFEYAAFYQKNFHVPDPNHPVLFRLHKTLDAEPMYNFVVMSDIHLSGPPLILNVEAGKVALQGDLAFSVALGPQTNRNGSDFSVTVQGVNGAEFVPSDEEFMSLAPESGYQKSLTTVHNISDPNYRPGQHSQFYVKTASGKYASVEADITLRDRFQTANLVAIIYYNPSGSRNLEFDQKKWINRK